MQTMLSHYRVLKQIGEGGQGKVFLAHDERLPRDVAIKILPAGAVADEKERARFKKEAFTLSKLNHPNIATILDFDNQDGMDFLVEEYIPGRSLDEILSSGALHEADILHLGVQICEGLATAHEQGVIHRDLKPANIRVLPTLDQRVKILDFGLAKLLPTTIGDDATVTLSETQFVAGTLPYMAPEQVANERIDERTDIWSLGCVLYEMAAGQRPFPGSGITLLDQIRREKPVAPARLNQEVSSGLEAVILKCLEKDPGERYVSVREVSVALRQLEMGGTPTAQRERQERIAWKIGAVITAVLVLTAGAYVIHGWMNQPKPISSILVLPLENLSADPQQEYMAAGITESLITNLGRLTGLKRVISYKGPKKPVLEIAKEIHADAVITGGVLRSGDRLRVTVQLTNATSNDQIWTQQFDRGLTDALRLQSEMTSTIADEIRVQLTAQERAQLDSARAVNPEAYDACLMGGYYLWKLSSAGFDKAMEYFQLALKKDPNYAPAYVGIGGVWGLRSHNSLIPPAEGWEKSRYYTQKALELDSTLAGAHLSMAVVYAYYDWNWEAGEKEFRRAIELEPNSAGAHQAYSLFLFAMRRQEEARAQIEQAVAIDPYSPMNQAILGWLLEHQGHFDEAIAHLRKAKELQPDNVFVEGTLISALENRNELEAWKEVRYPDIALPDEMAKSMDEAYARGGYWAWKRARADSLAASYPGSGVQPFNVALMYATLGEEELALDWLEKAYQQHSSKMPYANVVNEFDRLRSHPRFQDISRRMKFPPFS